MKTRIAAFPDGDTIEWSYDAIADRYGRDILEKQASVTRLAIDDHVHQFTNLLNKLDDVERKRLGIDRALEEVEDVSDLPDERVVHGIELIEAHLHRTKYLSKGA